MGKFGKETKILLLAITTICVISFLLATGIFFFLSKRLSAGIVAP